MKYVAAVFLLGLVAWGAASVAHAEEDGTFGVFYNSLGAHGEWLHVNGGLYAWHPAGVASGWRPYVHGRWMWTDDGWYWMSDEPWAWATYHYGRWYYDDSYGWVWIPGYEWAPAWVEWRYGGACMGWAPLGPYAVYYPGWGIRYSRTWETPISYWTFVDCRYIGSEAIHEHLYRSGDNERWFGQTRSAGNVRFEDGRIVTRGPARAYVERNGNIRVGRAEVVGFNQRSTERFTRSGGAGRIEVYRPSIGERSNEILRPERAREIDRPMGLDLKNTEYERRSLMHDRGRSGGVPIQPRPTVRNEAPDQHSGRNGSDRHGVDRVPKEGREHMDRPPALHQQRPGNTERVLRRRGESTPDGAARGEAGHRDGNRR